MNIIQFVYLTPPYVSTHFWPFSGPCEGYIYIRTAAVEVVVAADMLKFVLLAVLVAGGKVALFTHSQMEMPQNAARAYL